MAHRNNKHLTIDEMTHEEKKSHANNTIRNALFKQEQRRAKPYVSQIPIGEMTPEEKRLHALYTLQQTIKNQERRRQYLM